MHSFMCCQFKVHLIHTVGCSQVRRLYAWSCFGWDLVCFSWDLKPFILRHEAVSPNGQGSPKCAVRLTSVTSLVSELFINGHSSVRAAKHFWCSSPLKGPSNRVLKTCLESSLYMIDWSVIWTFNSSLICGRLYTKPFSHSQYRLQMSPTNCFQWGSFGVNGQGTSPWLKLCDMI